MSNQKKIILEWENADLLEVVGHKHLIHNLSGCAKSGEILGIFGSSGSGKTTFIDLLGGFVPYDKSATITLKINGRQISYLDFYKYTDYLSQFAIYFDKFTVEEFIYYSIRIRNGRNDKVVQLIYSLGLNDIRHRKMNYLSEGEIKKVFVASILCSDKPILFLDEPLSSLDSYQAKFVLDSFRKKADEGKLVIMSVHQPSNEIINSFDKFYFLAEGKLVYFGTKDGISEHFENAGVNLDLTAEENICDAVIKATTVYEDNENECLHAIKKLSTLQETENISRREIEISGLSLPYFKEGKNFLWYCYYLFIMIFRNVSNSIFNSWMITLFWLPFFAMIAASFLQRMLAERQSDSIILKLLDWFFYFLRVTGKAYTTLLEKAKRNGTNGLITNEDAVNTYTEIIYQRFREPIISLFFGFNWWTSIFFPYFFKAIFCTLIRHINILNIMVHNKRKGTFTYLESYLCFIIAFYPLLLITNILLDIFVSIIFNYTDFDYIGLIKNCIYTFGMTPLFLTSISIFYFWFIDQYNMMSFTKTCLLWGLAALFLKAHVLTIFMFYKNYFNVRNDESGIGLLFCILSFPLTRYFYFGLKELIFYTSLSMVGFLVWIFYGHLCFKWFFY